MRLFMRRLGVRIKPRRGRGGVGLLQAMTSSVTSGRWETTLTRGPGVAARQKREEGHGGLAASAGWLTGPAHYVACGERVVGLMRPSG
jgi:hypothetical protein